MGYSKFERQTWNDEKVRKWGRDMREVWFYLNTSPHMEGAGGRIGAYALDPMYAAADLSTPDHRWSPEEVEQQFVALHQRGRIVWDPESRVVMLVHFFRYNQPENPKQVTAAVTALHEIPASLTVLQRLRNSCLELLPEAFKSGTPLRKEILAAIDDRIAKAKADNNLNRTETVRETVTQTVGVTTEPEPEPEPNHTTTKSPSLRSVDFGADAPSDEQTEEELDPKAIRAEVIPLIRKHLWLGKDPPPGVLEKEPKWGMGREADIAIQWLKAGDVADLEEACALIRYARHALDIDGPLSLLFLNSKEYRDRFQEALQYARREVTRQAARETEGDGPARIGEGIQGVAGGR